MYIDNHDWFLTRFALSIFFIFSVISGGLFLAFSTFAFLIFLVLMILKIIGYLICSWWVVTIPLWGVPASICVFFLISVIPAFFIDLIVLGWNKFKGDKI